MAARIAERRRWCFWGWLKIGRPTLDKLAMRTDWQTLVRERDDLRATNAAMGAAYGQLDRYAQHHDGCAFHVPDRPAEPTPCDCGLAELLALATPAAEMGREIVRCLKILQERQQYGHDLDCDYVVDGERTSAKMNESDRAACNCGYLEAEDALAAPRVAALLRRNGVLPP